MRRAWWMAWDAAWWIAGAIAYGYASWYQVRSYQIGNPVTAQSAAAIFIGWWVIGAWLLAVALTPMVLLARRMMHTDARQCPHCAEWVQREAVRCKHCQAALTPALEVKPKPKSEMAVVWPWVTALNLLGLYGAAQDSRLLLWQMVPVLAVTAAVQAWLIGAYVQHRCIRWAVVRGLK